MIINLLNKIHTSHSSLRIALVSERRKHLPANNKFWGQIYSNIMEIEKLLITINFIEKFLLNTRNYTSIKSYLDLVTYWKFWNKKSSERIIFESKKFFFSSHKEKRLFFSYLELINNFTLNQIFEEAHNPAEKWSITNSLPILLYTMLSKDYSIKELNLLGKWSNTLKPRYIWINNQENDYTSLINKIRLKTSLLEIASVNKAFIVSSKIPIQGLEEYKRGKVLIQDLGATIISQLVPKVSGIIIDLCASPGNKTVQIFDKYTQFEDCTIFAGDLPGSRYNMLMKRLPFLLQTIDQETHSKNPNKLEISKNSKKIVVQTWDGTNLSFDDNFADLVFIDAPCTGSGTMNSKPDVRLQLDEQFILKHVEIQKKLLLESNRILKSEGFLFYTTCSLLKEENENQISSFLLNFPNYSVVPLYHKLNYSKLIIDGSIKLFPPLSKTDGFFAILLKKNKKMNILGNN